MKVLAALVLLGALALFVFLSDVHSAEKPQMVWPHTKVNTSDSFLPAVVQVLTYLMDRSAKVEPVAIASTTADPSDTTTTGQPVTDKFHLEEEDDDQDEDEDSYDNWREGHGSKPDLRPTIGDILLGSLRHILSNEAKKKGFARIQGYSPSVLEVLQKTSEETSVEQLKILLKLMLKNNNIQRKDSIAQSELILESLENPSSLLQKALAGLPALQYSL